MILIKTKNARSKKIYKNIFLSMLVKGGSVGVGLLLIPLTINYINPVQYGIWLTISSVVSWLSLFDAGLSNGLRNKLSQALAANEIKEAKTYVSTTYVTLSVICVALFLFYYSISSFIDWRSFLNIPADIKDDFQMLLLIVVGTFLLQLVMQIINFVLTACHEPASAGLITFLGQLLILIIIFIFKRTIPGTLSLLVITMMIAPVIVQLLSSLVFYNTRLKKFAPIIKMARLDSAKDILSLGGSFFFIQVSALVLLFTDNIIITKVIGPQAVTEFNIAYRLYSVITMIFFLIVNPYWSAFTDAYMKADYGWMKDNLSKLRKIWLGMSLLLIPIIYVFSENIFYIWLGDSVKVHCSLSLTMSFYAVGHSLLFLNSYLLNGMGKLKMQILLFIIGCTLNLPLSIYLGKLYGTTGIAASSVIIFIIMGAFMWVQNTKLVNNTAQGIWDT